MHWKIIIIFICCTILYSFLGGVVFHLIETLHEDMMRNKFINILNNFQDSMTCLDSKNLAEFNAISKKMKQAGLLIKGPNQGIINVTNWDIGSSIFLASQIIGSIGYGNVTPKTTAGRVFTVLYTCVGIPLFVILAFGIGRPIARLVRYIEHHIKKICFTKKHNQDTDLTEHRKIHKIRIYLLRVLILFGIGSVLFVVIPAAIFRSIESQGQRGQWSYGRAVYCSYVTVLSVGFGECEPGFETTYIYGSLYRVTVSLWIYISVSFFVVVFSPIHEALDFRREVIKPVNSLDKEVFDEQIKSRQNRKQDRSKFLPADEEFPMQDKKQIIYGEYISSYRV